jgi:hypothetical protein
MYAERNAERASPPHALSTISFGFAASASFAPSDNSVGAMPAAAHSRRKSRRRCDVAG